MIKSITITNHLGESMKLELMFPERSGFVVQGIEGLGPCKATINSKEIATNDGSTFNSARSNSRNIVLSLMYLFNPTIEATRQKSYKYFPIKKKIKMEVETDGRILETYGYVESNEPNIFSKQESATISIVCPDPYFYSQGTSVTLFSGVIPEFEFEFSNESSSQKLLNMGSIQMNTAQTVYYQGDSKVGFMMYINLLGPASGVSIFNTDTAERMTIDSDKLISMTGEDLHVGDEIVISTRTGNKYINLIRDGVTTNILNTLDRGTDWFSLEKGDNVFAFTATSGGSNLQFRIENQVLFEGV